VNVRRIGWMGTRTPAFEETARFFGEVLGLEQVDRSPGFAMFRLPAADRDFVEVFSPHEAAPADGRLYTTGPVVGFVVDDVEAARRELELVGVELLGEIVRVGSLPGYAYFHFRAPDGCVYAMEQGTAIIDPR
jgi:catechol 2,3-dioxygenase-like lactoylglutathione lyase family enzyme